MVKFQILLSPNHIDAAGRLGRMKAVVVALLLASAFIGFLIAALLLGSILAVGLVILIAVALTVALFKAAIRRPGR
jgi:hypothetical protein